MRILTTVSPKGGAGKTTLAMVLASELAHRGQSVCLVDADPNTPLEVWASRGQTPDNLHVLVDSDPGGDTIFDTIEAAKERADWVIIDTEGTPNIRVTRAITEAGLCLIPLKPSHLDASGAAKAVKLIRDCSRQMRRKIPFAIAYTQTSAAIVTGSEKDIREQMQSHDLPALSTGLMQREAYVKIFALDTTLYDLKASEVSGLDKARANAAALTDNVIAAYAAGVKSMHERIAS
ncbi:MAG: ParA family protein [Alphaproteobacteria bacterium GM202ARS2]|nr:ParA family protein [Alphaproteobacteria bacterium GM202ARS2]